MFSAAYTRLGLVVLLWAAGCISGAPLTAPAATDFFASPTGNDAHDGTSATSPFRTLGRAMAAASSASKALTAAGTSGVAVTVHLAPGAVFQQAASPVNLSGEGHSGTAAVPIVVQSGTAAAEEEESSEGSSSRPHAPRAAMRAMLSGGTRFEAKDATLSDPATGIYTVDLTKYLPTNTTTKTTTAFDLGSFAPSGGLGECTVNKAEVFFNAQPMDIAR